VIKRFCPKTPSLVGLLLVLVAPILQAEEINIAVASNFRSTASKLATQFNAGHSDQVVMIFGGSGKLYAQITQGAPFDIFLSADTERPKLLESKGLAIAGTRFTYAIGRLTLWSAKPGLVDSDGEVLRQATFAKLAIANPRHAPYGMAAKQVLSNLALDEVLASKIVLGNNIEQTFQYVSSSNAELGFVARSQLAQSIWGKEGSRWEVPASLHEPLDQQAVLIHDKPAARAFLELLANPESREVIQADGYDLP
jgi:molybdate transport system substrate-binding protein